MVHANKTQPDDPDFAGFKDKNPGLGIQGTKVRASFLNMLHDELLNAATEAEIEPATQDDPDNTQLAAIIAAIAAKRARRDACINGAFQVWQRGLTFNVADAVMYTADRWRARADGAGGSGAATVSRVAATPGEFPVGVPHFLRFLQTAGATNANPRLEHVVEDVTQFSAVERCWSIYLRANTTIDCSLILVQTFGPGGSGDVTVETKAIQVSSSVQRFHVADLLPTVLGKTINPGSGLVLMLQMPTGATFQLDVALSQLDVGLLPAPFELRSKADEFNRCLRYYQSSYPEGVPAGTATNDGARFARAWPGTASPVRPLMERLHPMRVTPTVTAYNPFNGAAGEIRNAEDNTNVSVSSIALTTPRSTGAPVISGVAEKGYGWHWTADAEL